MRRPVKIFAPIAVVAALLAAAIGVARAGEDAAAEMLKVTDEAAEERKALAAEAQRYFQIYTARFRVYTRSETHLILQLCSPDGRTHANLSRTADRFGMKLARVYAEYLAWRTSAQICFDPRGRIRAKLSAEAEANLSPEQFALYRREVSARAAFEKSVALQNLVASLDRILLLTVDQRAEVLGALEEGWNPEWDPYVLNSLAARRRLPNIPSRLLEPFLTTDQKSAWESAAKFDLDQEDSGMMILGFGTDAIEDEPGVILEGRE